MVTSKVCKWCGQKTNQQDSVECDSCWELRSRIERQPDIASRILESCVRTEPCDITHNIKED